MIVKQGRETTIVKEGSLEGVGLHTGQKCRITVKPARPGTGVRFQRVDLEHKPLVEAKFDHLIEGDRLTALGLDDLPLVKTTEHFLAAAAGLGYDNLKIETTGPELPAFDGSGLAYYKLLKNCQQKVQPQPKTYFLIEEEVRITHRGAELICKPLQDQGPPYFPRYEYFLDYGSHPPGVSQAVYHPPDSNFANLISARTFALEKELAILKKAGLAKGGSRQNAIIFDQLGPDKSLRMENEAAAHKLIDLIGDLFLAGPVLANFIGIKSGHNLNQRMVHKVNGLSNQEV